MTDEDQILALHQAWFDAAANLDVEGAREVTVAGEHYLMFNTNGHVYEGFDEMAQLWRHYGETIALSTCQDDAKPVVTVDGNLAVLTCKREFMDISPLRSEGLGSSVMAPLDEEKPTRYPFFATEVYRRDDGAGNADWRIWQQHFSVIAPADEPRPGF